MTEGEASFFANCSKSPIFAKKILMIQATFTLSVNDLNELFIERVRAFVQSQNVTVTIQIRPQGQQAKAEYFAALDESIAQLQQGDKLVQFTTEEFMKFSQKTA